MKLEWFRQHKKFVYYILLPVVGGGMAFFGVGTMLKSQATARGAGPSLTYTTPDGKTHSMDPSEVLALRWRYLKFETQRRMDVSSHEAATRLVAARVAQASGLEAGEEEMKAKLREEVKDQIRKREGVSDIKINDELYRKLLDTLGLSASQFQRTAHEVELMRKFFRLAADDQTLPGTITRPLVSDPELFTTYMRDKEVVRLRYKEVKTEDFLAQAAAPAEDKIKKFYEENTKEKEQAQYLKHIFIAPPKMSAEALYIDTGEFAKNLTPTDKEIEDYYNQFKVVHWKLPNPDGQVVTKPEDMKFKPLQDVKSEVVQEWLKANKGVRVNLHASELKQELQRAEKKHSDEQAQKPEAERKPFDVAEYAKQKGYKYWITEELTEEEFGKGKSGPEAVGAPNVSWVKFLFYYTRTTPNQDPRITEMFQRQLADFREFTVDPSAPEKGIILLRKKNLVAERVKTLDESRVAITEHLKIENARELAEKEAKKIREEWAEGKNLPDVEKLAEKQGDSKDKHALLNKFFTAAKPIGQVLEVAEGPADEDPQSTNYHSRFYIGFAVERQLPTWKTFNADVEWDRDAARRRQMYSAAQFTGEALQTAIGRRIEMPRNVKDPLLSENLRNVPIDDY